MSLIHRLLKIIYIIAPVITVVIPGKHNISAVNPLYLTMISS
jgi:hypothetical protein